MKSSAIAIVLALSVLVSPAWAHDVGESRTLVIDTDMGIDDVVTLAMALQYPDVEISAIVATEGVVSGQVGAASIEHMLERFNRRDVTIYGVADPSLKPPVPPFRAFAEDVLKSALSGPLPAKMTRPFTPAAYVHEGTKTTVLLLGPMTNFAAALRSKPEIKEQIARVIVPGQQSKRSFNVRYDTAAAQFVLQSGLPFEFIDANETAMKPGWLAVQQTRIGQGTSIAESLLNDMFSNPEVRTHYAEQLKIFHDELAMMYLADHHAFHETAKEHVVEPNGTAAVADLFRRLVSEGRQHKDRVVFSDRPLPDIALRNDVRDRRASIVEKNGETEWFAQVLMNEMHEHLGAYSIIGVKMGLFAAEQLNAPQHGMKIVSHTPAEPPVSCLNDGLIVATGCTPGRGLFRHEPGEKADVVVEFAAGTKRIKLRLKDEYKKRIAERIGALRKEHGLEDAHYWEGVRTLGLDIWENWHRRDLFAVVP